MSGCIRVLLIFGAMALLGFMLKKIRMSKLKIEYSIFWVGFAVILVLMGIFPQLLTWVAGALGFQSSVNMVYLIIIFVLIVKLFYNTIQMSALENKIDNLAQQIAIDRKIDQNHKLEESKEEFLDKLKKKEE